MFHEAYLYFWYPTRINRQRIDGSAAKSSLGRPL